MRLRTRPPLLTYLLTVHSPPDPWGRNTAKQNATANSSPEDNTECGPVRAPARGRQREEQAGPPRPQKKTKNNRGGRGGARKQPTAIKPPANTTRGGKPPPPQKAQKTGPPKRHRGTIQPKPATPSQEQRPTGKRETETCRHTHKKKKKSQQPGPKERGWGDRNHKARDRDTKQKKKSAKNTPQQPSQERLGTAEMPAQHARPHRTPEPETAGGKPSAHETTHVP